MLSSISLTSSMRTSLLSLHGIDKDIDRTQRRLSTGRKVDTPLDNPTNFFAAQLHLNRANDILGCKTMVLEAIQSIQAADNGITGVLSLLKSLTGIANAARNSQNQTERDSYAEAFDSISAQIDTLAADSSYRGTNLLKGDSLIVEFSESSGKSTLSIEGADVSYFGLGISKASAAVDNNGPYVVGGPLFTTESFTLEEATNVMSNNDKYRFVSGTAIATVNPGMATTDFSKYSLDGNIVSGIFSSNTVMSLEYYPDGVDPLTGIPISNTNPWDTQLSQLESATDTVRSVSKRLSSSGSILSIRNEFTDAFSNILQEGAGNLTLADMNEEGSNMLMLETRQNLSIASLQLASQESKSVLKLF